MGFFIHPKATRVDLVQGRLMQLAASFLFVFAILLTLSPAARLHSWNVNYPWEHWIGFVVWLVSSLLIHRQIIQHFPERDPYLFPLVALLSGWGLLTIWRLDLVLGARQSVWLALSMAILWAGIRTPDLLAQLRRYKYLWLVGGLLLTALTFLFGTYPSGNGPRLWLGCCGVYLQPSEPLKLLLIVYLAAYLADQLPISFSMATLLTPTLILMGAALVLLIGQRDLGTASLFILIYTLIIYLASGKRRTLVISGLGLLAAGIIGYLLFDVVRIRVDAWINPWADPNGRSYQIVQSLIAAGVGDILGRGPGLGSPGVVPVAHSDFIFMAVFEETGLLGVVGMLLAYGLLVVRGFRAALFATNNYRRYLAGGLSAYLAIQAIFIIGGNLRLLPLTGLTLPFVSYGGSSLLTAFLSILLLMLASHATDEEEQPAPLTRIQPYLFASAGILAGLAALALLGGWWAGIRAEDLRARPDNPRLSINDRYVRRGTLLDRNNLTITHTTGKSGSYQRIYEYPPLSTTTGYNSPQFGTTGLEAGLDPYLRGLKGNPASLIYWDFLLYGQPPPGLNVRLSLDLEIQQQIDTLLNDHQGAVVVLNADSGEILAMASHPYYDPNTLDQTWDELLQDKNAPLLNRATQGLYPPGTALGPFLLAEASAQGKLPSVPNQLAYQTETRTWECAQNPDMPLNWGSLIGSGCPAPIVRLSQSMTTEELEILFRSLGFYQAPDLPLPVALANAAPVEQKELAGIGQENLSVTPLQMALAAAALTNQGERPAPRIASAIQTPYSGWAVLPHDNAVETVLRNGTNATLEMLQHGSDPYWSALGTAHANQQQLTWCLAGNLPQWQGTPLAVAVVIEEDSPSLAKSICQAVLSQTP